MKYPHTDYEIRTNHNSREMYTLGSYKTLRKAREALMFWSSCNPININTQWTIAKAITVANGIIERKIIM